MAVGGDFASHVEAIRDLHERWTQAEEAGDVDAVLDMCLDDVTFLVPGSAPIVGKESARLLFTQAPPRIIGIRTVVTRIECDEQLGWKLARYQARFVPYGADCEVVSHGTHLWVLRRGEDGQWRVAACTWQSSDSPEETGETTDSDE